MISTPTTKYVTIVIDPELHLAMKMLAKKKLVHISLLYSEAIQEFLDKQVKSKPKGR